MFDRAEIERHIPHREPFLFVDEVVGFEPYRHLRSVLRLTGEEPFFAGHFPGQAMMPGVLILEHMAQSACFLVARSRAGTSAAPPGAVFAGVDRARFLRPVRPGQRLVTDVSALKLFETMGTVEAESHVGGDLVARARLSFGTVVG